MIQYAPSPIQAHFPVPTISRKAVVGCILGMLVLTACSGAPSALAPSVEISPLPSGGSSSPSPEFTAAENTPTAGHSVEAQGVYPPPGSATEGTSQPKALGTPGSNAIYLPAIINEKFPEYPFELQQSGVIAMQGFYGCNWIGVAGLVFGLNEIPINNLILHLEGFWAGKAISVETLSGSAPQYGTAGGYEFILGTQPADSTQALWIQVLDATHKELSARIYLDTYNDCARNLILVNFNQVR
jgi:hypothetical protein